MWSVELLWLIRSYTEYGATHMSILVLCGWLRTGFRTVALLVICPTS